VEEGGVMRNGNGLIRIALAFAALLGSFSLVVWRQSRALEMLRDLHASRVERAIVEAERAELARRVALLESRGHVVSAAARLGLRVPAASEIVILPLTEPAPASRAVAATESKTPVLAHAGRRGGKR
jgi:hypothetical protein